MPTYTKAIFEFNGKILPISNKKISNAMSVGKCKSIDLDNKEQMEAIVDIVLSTKNFWTAQDMDALTEMDDEIWRQCVTLIAQ